MLAPWRVRWQHPEDRSRQQQRRAEQVHGGSDPGCGAAARPGRPASRSRAARGGTAHQHASAGRPPRLRFLPRVTRGEVGERDHEAEIRLPRDAVQSAPAIPSIRHAQSAQQPLQADERRRRTSRGRAHSGAVRGFLQPDGEHRPSSCRRCAPRIRWPCSDSMSALCSQPSGLMLPSRQRPVREDHARVDGS